MKKILLLFCLIAFNKGKTQTWCPPGATWNYNYQMNSTSFTNGVAEYKYSADTVINSIMCKKISATFSGINNNPGVTITNLQNYFTYFNNNVVYLYNSFKNVFDTIVNYNANIGDKWLIVNRQMFYCDSNINRSHCTVTNTGTTNINNITLKTFTLSGSYIIYNAIVSMTYAVGYYHVITERIGGSFLFPINCSMFDGPPNGVLLCYTDDTFPLYKVSPNTSCYYNPVGIGEYNLMDGPLSIYPNPVNNFLYLRSESLSRENLDLEIINTLGEKVLTSKFEDKIDVSYLTKGIYFLLLFDKGKLISKEKLIKE